MKNIYVTFFIFCFCYLKIANAQLYNSSFDVSYNHFLLNTRAHLISFNGENVNDANIYHQSFSGIRSDTKEYYLDFNRSINKRNRLGIQFYSLRETSLFTRSKGHLNYAIDIPLSSNARLSAGTSVGFSGIFFGATSTTVGGGDLAFDGSIASTLTLKDWQLGLGLNQISDAILQPIVARFLLKRYGEVILLKENTLNQDWRITNGIKYITNLEVYEIELDNRIQYKDTSILFSLKRQTSFSASLGVAHIINFSGKKSIDINFSYAIPLINRGRLSTPKYAIGTGFKF